jgi:hypothetical protein
MTIAAAMNADALLLLRLLQPNIAIASTASTSTNSQVALVATACCEEAVDIHKSSTIVKQQLENPLCSITVDHTSTSLQTLAYYIYSYFGN